MANVSPLFTHPCLAHISCFAQTSTHTRRVRKTRAVGTVHYKHPMWKLITLFNAKNSVVANRLHPTRLNSLVYCCTFLRNPFSSCRTRCIFYLNASHTRESSLLIFPLTNNSWKCKNKERKKEGRKQNSIEFHLSGAWFFDKNKCCRTNHALQLWSRKFPLNSFQLRTIRWR